MCGLPDTQLMPLCGLKRHEGVYCRYERNLYGGKPLAGAVGIGSLRAGVGLEVSHAVQSWHRNRDELTAFFEFLVEIRKIIYTTNITENLNGKIRKYTKSKLLFPTDDALRRSICLALLEIKKKWTVPIHNWGIVMNQFITIFENRIGI